MAALKQDNKKRFSAPSSSGPEKIYVTTAKQYSNHPGRTTRKTAVGGDVHMKRKVVPEKRKIAYEKNLPPVYPRWQKKTKYQSSDMQADTESESEISYDCSPPTQQSPLFPPPSVHESESSDTEPVSEKKRRVARFKYRQSRQSTYTQNSMIGSSMGGPQVSPQALSSSAGNTCVPSPTPSPQASASSTGNTCVPSPIPSPQLSSCSTGDVFFPSPQYSFPIGQPSPTSSAYIRSPVSSIPMAQPSPMSGAYIRSPVSLIPTAQGTSVSPCPKPAPEPFFTVSNQPEITTTNKCSPVLSKPVSATTMQYSSAPSCSASEPSSPHNRIRTVEKLFITSQYVTVDLDNSDHMVIQATQDYYEGAKELIIGQRIRLEGRKYESGCVEVERMEKVDPLSSEMKTRSYKHSNERAADQLLEKQGAGPLPKSELELEFDYAPSHKPDFETMMEHNDDSGAECELTPRMYYKLYKTNPFVQQDTTIACTPSKNDVPEKDQGVQDGEEVLMRHLETDNNTDAQTPEQNTILQQRHTLAQKYTPFVQKNITTNPYMGLIRNQQSWHHCPAPPMPEELREPSESTLPVPRLMQQMMDTTRKRCAPY